MYSLPEYHSRSQSTLMTERSEACQPASCSSFAVPSSAFLFVLFLFVRFSYDAVLVDAPCSTDRHMLHASRAELENWAVGRFRRDHERQVALLLQALRTVREGGVVLYATCSLSPQENDDVIRSVRSQLDKWLLKGRTGVEGIQIDFDVEKMVGANESATHDSSVVRMPFGEATEFGWIILPDQPDTAAGRTSAPGTNSPHPAHGWGPLYLCKLRRTRVTAADATEPKESAPSSQ